MERILENKFEAIMLIGEIKKYFSRVIRYFNSITKMEVQRIITENTGSKNSSLLAQAAICSKHWDWNDISQLIEQMNYDEDACRAIIKSRRLSGHQIISILNSRVNSIGLVSIGPLITEAIETEKLTGQELIILLSIYKSDSIIGQAAPQLIKYIESPEEEPAP